MALSRKELEAFGIDEKIIDQIVEKHGETVSGLKSEIDELKQKASQGDGLAEELAEAKAKATEAEKQASKYKALYEGVSDDFNTYKSDITAKETLQAKQNAYRELLKQAGVSDKRLESVLKVSDLDALEIEDGKIKDSDKLSEQIKQEWSDFITQSDAKGADVDTPPNPGEDDPDPSKMSDEEYYAWRKEQK